MTAKELRQGLRRSSFVYPFLLIHLLAVASVAAEFEMGSSHSGSDYVGVLNFWLLVSSGPFWMVAGAVCLLVLPLGGLLLMGQELEDGNHELLLLTRLNRWRVVMGKFITLWGLCVLTFLSLLPYLVVRYLVGGIEWWHEAACAGTVLGGAAIVSAAMIGASAFAGVAARIGVSLLFFGSMFLGAGAALAGAGAATGMGVVYHFTALAAVVCYVTFGLALARSRLRLALLAYEVKPSGMMIGILFFSPFVIGMVTAVTVGFAGMIGLVGMAVVAWKLDLTPRAGKSVPAPASTVPPLL